MPSMDYLKVVIVGDGAVGKTSMLIAYTTGTFPNDYVPTVFDNYSATIIVDGKSLNLGLWDTAGQEDYDRLRPLSYPGTHVFLVCYSVNSLVSFNNVRTKWYPEITAHCPGVPFILVGTKADMRLDQYEIQEMMKRGQSMVTEADADKLCQALSGYRSMECSALTHVGLKAVFDEAIRCALTGGKGSKGGKKKGGGGCIML